MTEITMVKKYSDIKGQIYDGDIIFFAGTEYISKAIMEAEKFYLGDGDWSHCGMVISRRNLTTLKNSKDSPDTLMLWESTMSSTYKIVDATMTVDVESGKAVFGVQIRNFEEVITRSLQNGVKIGWGRLLNNPLKKKDDETDDDFDKRKIDIIGKLNYLHGMYFHKAYPLNIIRIMRGLFSCCTCIQPLSDKGDVFCSQWVAIVLKEIGILNKNYVSSEVLPVDLSDPENSEEKFGEIVDGPIVLSL